MRSTDGSAGEKSTLRLNGPFVFSTFSFAKTRVDVRLRNFVMHFESLVVFRSVSFFGKLDGLF